MKIALIFLIVIVVLAIVGYYRYFPRNTHISFSRSNGGFITFSRSGVVLEAPPDQYATNGFDQIESYVTRLCKPNREYRSLGIFTPDGIRGFGLDANEDSMLATLSIEWRKEPQRESKIRSFFEAFGISPVQDYAAGNGAVPNATRVLVFPVKGNASEVASLTKRILEELCMISPTEALEFTYSASNVLTN
jgi:hypothetical protein